MAIAFSLTSRLTRHLRRAVTMFYRSGQRWGPVVRLGSSARLTRSFFRLSSCLSRRLARDGIAGCRTYNLPPMSNVQMVPAGPRVRSHITLALCAVLHGLTHVYGVM